VLASRIGGIKHFVNDYRDGLLADRLSPAGFAEKMSWAFDHPIELSEMRHAARRRALNLFDVGVVNTKMNTLYERAIAQNDGENE
jgi:glycosyltransferase involved in cell wall biosynthesis